MARAPDPDTWNRPSGIRRTACRAASSRFTATKASFCTGSMIHADPGGTVAPDAMASVTNPAIFWNGPSKPSMIRSNFTPICSARVYPALS